MLIELPTGEHDLSAHIGSIGSTIFAEKKCYCGFFVVVCLALDRNFSISNFSVL